MVTLYCHRSDPSCREAREALDRLAVAHEYINVSGKSSLPGSGPLPMIVDEGRTYCGPRAVKSHLDDLNYMADQWGKCEGDSCYCDEDVGSE